MNKAQALDSFWNSFGIPAYEENSVPDKAGMPYITYSKIFDTIGNVAPMNASLWYYSDSWTAIHRKFNEISQRINENGYVNIPLDNGYMVIMQGTPFGQSIADTNDKVKRIYINISVEYLTSY